LPSLMEELNRRGRGRWVESIGDGLREASSLAEKEDDVQAKK
jgi:hypothetical protein